MSRPQGKNSGQLRLVPDLHQQARVKLFQRVTLGLTLGIVNALDKSSGPLPGVQIVLFNAQGRGKFIKPSYDKCVGSEHQWRRGPGIHTVCEAWRTVALLRGRAALKKITGL